MYGGRVMTRRNESILLENTKIATLDADSLYPSACVLIKGFLKGKPKVLTDFTKEFLDLQDYYYVDIIIKSIGIRRQLPLLSIKRDESIEYTDDIEKLKDQVITVGKGYLEDLIKYQKIEYQIIRGLYFDEGFNDKINKTIYRLYEKRLELKKQGNPAQEIYKLIMNSIYGKLLQKPKDKKIIIKNGEEEMMLYLRRNKSNIEMVEKFYGCEKYCIREFKEINNDFNSVHLGCQVLDASKHIMNELVTLAEDNGMDVYYTDTDSLHLGLENLRKLEKLYLEKYGRQMNTGQLGGFKPDFNDKKKGYNGVDDLYATDAVYIGKKLYYCKLKLPESFKEKEDYARARGITSKSLKYTADQLEISMLDLYKKRYNGERIPCDLTCGGEAFTASQKFNFSFIETNHFTRNL